MTNSRVKKALSAFAILVAGAMTVTLSGCAGSADSGADAAGASAETTKIVLGADDGAEKHWTTIKDKLKAEGIDLEVKTITDAVQLNSGVSNGDLDVNLFQHLIFLSQYNVDNNADLVPIGATAVYPLALWSLEYNDVADLPSDAVVAIPNNPTNLARALINLQTVGLVELKDGGNALSTEADIVSSKVQIKAVDANQTVATLKDGSADAAIVNNTQAQKGGLTDDDILFKEDVDDPALAPYINAFVVSADDKDDPVWAKLVEAYHSTEVEEQVSELNNGNLVFKADWTAAKLQEELVSLEDLIKESK